ncbi:Helicase-like protein [Planktothrix serta PCC 8927]|uniref:Helicase-like protein n=1 Tax=Planktothrix serta PCC 8927 TaxID=671068 RepID=A0A7Z9DXZ9_9CYAN|nr:helicase-related protein [Planktothrix serta]VXD15259.1 Helicase-like protein [Planktothrix serta PCC 8927]
MTKSKLGQELGRLFEVGFNIGMLTYIEQKQLSHKFGSLYRQDLQNISFSQIVKALVKQEQIIDEKDKKNAEKWSLFFLKKAFLAGLKFLDEYIQAMGLSQNKLKHLEILYYQCCFDGNNSLGTYNKNIDPQAIHETLSQLISLEVNQVKEYSQKGNFLQADTLILIQCRGEYRILCIDYSIFSIKAIQNLGDLEEIEVLRKLLLSEISYLKSKSVFSNLGLDTKISELNISKELKTYFIGFKREDKETAKLIQAGSYVDSFYKFLRSHNLLNPANSVIFNIVGYSDRGISSMSINQENLEILETCAEIYKYKATDQQIQDGRRDVLRKINRNAYRSFNQGKQFIDQLLAVNQYGITPIIHSEKIEGFCNSIDIIPQDLATKLQVTPNIDLRKAHAELITQALNSDVTYIFLTGNPGIGKTTAITNFLKTQQCLNEGFLFFYVSPRKQVNLDIIEKFKNPENQQLEDDRIFAITTSSVLIANNKGKYTVNYLNNQCSKKRFTQQGVDFIPQDYELLSTKPSKNLDRITEDEIQAKNSSSRGVLNSICQGIYTLINRQTSNNIVATVSIQSLKKTQNSQDTLEHFEKIFKDAYNSREGIPIPEKMRAISGRIKHLLIMIDEITGDDGGTEFLNRISEILKQYGLTNSTFGFNTKIIVADASIVDPDVIKQHLGETTSEPNKIFFRKAKSEDISLSIQPFSFNSNQFNATVINANSYPAKNLEITYKVFIQSNRYNEESSLIKNYDLEKEVQEEMITDINNFLDNQNSEQIIIYIQDKQRLANLIEKIRKHQNQFEQYQDYLEIHANLSEDEKIKISEYKNQVKVIFMTASASRGLSFPKVKQILVDIPRFEIEKNLMEVIQVIYRGRGSYNQDGLEKTLDDQDKHLVFYLCEQVIIYPKQHPELSSDSKDDQQLSRQESVLNILNILLILKTSIMTRIFGSGRIGSEYFMMIPIGGKSVFTAGQTFSSKMSNLIKQLKKEHTRRPYDPLLKSVYSSLEALLSSVEINLGMGNTSPEDQGLSYLELQTSFTSKFSELLNNNLEGLLNFPPIQSSYINGSLLIVPLTGRFIEERYKMRLEQEILSFNNRELLHQMSRIANSSTYPENICYALKEAIELVNLLLEQPYKTQKFEQNSQYLDQYYVIPLFTLITGEALRQYFTSQEPEPEDLRFRDILAAYIRCLYPVCNILPIGHQYKDFPWILFRSYSLNEIRGKLFTDKYFLMSHELNVLNLILSHD